MKTHLIAAVIALVVGFTSGYCTRMAQEPRMNAALSLGLEQMQRYAEQQQDIASDWQIRTYKCNEQVEKLRALADASAIACVRRMFPKFDPKDGEK